MNILSKGDLGTLAKAAKANQKGISSFSYDHDVGRPQDISGGER
jgi:hypothetical protein